jgi:hypothetical protein
VSKIRILVSLLAIAAGALGCESRKSAEQRYCASLGPVNDGLEKVAAMGPNTSLEEMRHVAGQLKDASSKAAQEGRRLGSDTAQLLTSASNQLAGDMRDLPANSTVAQVQAKLADDGQQVKRQAHALATQAGCPEELSLR